MGKKLEDLSYEDDCYLFAQALWKSEKKVHTLNFKYRKAGLKINRKKK